MERLVIKTVYNKFVKMPKKCRPYIQTDYVCIHAHEYSDAVMQAKDAGDKKLLAEVSAVALSPVASRLPRLLALHDIYISKSLRVVAKLRACLVCRHLYSVHSFWARLRCLNLHMARVECNHWNTVSMEIYSCDGGLP
jgi:hypothetical protein